MNQRQVTVRVEIDRARFGDHFQIAAFSGFAEVRGGAFDFGDVERVVDPHDFGIGRVREADGWEGGFKDFLVAGVVQRDHRSGTVAAG